MSNVLEVNDILLEIRNTSGAKAKASILEKHKNNQLLLDILEFTFDSSITTNLSTKKLNKKVVLEGDELNNIYAYMIFLKITSTGKDKDIATVQRFINTHPKEVHPMLKEMAVHKMTIGMKATAINKVVPGLIHEFEVMRGKLACEDEIRKIKGEFWITAKHNGVRCIAFVLPHGVELYTRQGKPIFGLTEIEEKMSCLPKNRVYDGEVVRKNPDNIPHGDNFRITAGIMNQDGEKVGLEYYIFDSMPIDEFKAGMSVANYGSRRAWMEENIERYQHHLYPVQLSPVLTRGTDKNLIEEVTKWAEENNYEGTMINVDKPYVCKKTNHILKGKNFLCSSFEVVAVEEGTGKNKNKCGKLVIEMQIEGKTYYVGVGTGLSDLDREEFRNAPESIIGKVIDVAYFEISSDKDGNLSLQFPSYKGIRIDKKGSPDKDYDIEGYKEFKEKH